MNNDLISRSALKERNTVIGIVNGEKMKVVPVKAIDNAPTVDLWEMRQEATENALKKAEVLYKRPQGEWIRIGSIGNGNANYECSNCHHSDIHAEDQKVPYCWFCGAEMR